MNIVSLDPAVTELLFAIDVKPKAVSKESDYPEHKLPLVGSQDKPNVDKIQEYEPDVVIANPQAAKALEAQGINTIVYDPKSLDDVYAQWKAIAQKIGAQDATQALINKVKVQLMATESKVKGTEQKELYTREQPPKWLQELAHKASVLLMHLDNESKEEQEKPHLEMLAWMRTSPRLNDVAQHIGAQVHPERFQSFGSMTQDLDGYYQDIDLPDPKAQYEN